MWKCCPILRKQPLPATARLTVAFGVFCSSSSSAFKGSHSSCFLLLSQMKGRWLESNCWDRLNTVLKTIQLVSLQGEKFWSGFLIPFEYIFGLYQCLMASFTRIMQWKRLVLPCHFPLKTVPKDPEPILWPSVIWPSGISQSSLESLLPKVFYSTGHLVSITTLKICWKKNTEAYDNILPSYCGPRMRMTTCALFVGTATSVEL